MYLCGRQTTFTLTGNLFLFYSLYAIFYPRQNRGLPLVLPRRQPHDATASCGCAPSREDFFMRIAHTILIHFHTTQPAQPAAIAAEHASSPSKSMQGLTKSFTSFYSKHPIESRFFKSHSHCRQSPAASNPPASHGPDNRE